MANALSTGSGSERSAARLRAGMHANHTRSVLIGGLRGGASLRQVARAVHGCHRLQAAVGSLVMQQRRYRPALERAAQGQVPRGGAPLLVVQLQRGGRGRAGGTGTGP